jgi:predicted MPP superfamily phosphohydrolase
MMVFEFGAFGPLFIRWERVQLPTPQRLRLLYVSDLHLGHWWNASLPKRLLEAARIVQPDVILLGGDLADHLSGLPVLTNLIASLKGLAPVLAVPGNHDVRLGLDAVRETVVRAGGGWIPDGSIESPAESDGIVRPLSIRPRILCAHEPSVFPAAANAGYHLVLAGHLHGGQCVFSNRGGKQYPAVWFHRWHGMRFQDRGSTMLVSRGAADAFPFRFNCPREVLAVEI